MVRKLFMLAAMVLGLVSDSARAGDFDDPHFYLILGGLTGFQDFGDTECDTECDSQGDIEKVKVENSLGFEMRFGVRGNKFLALELQADFITGFDTDVPINGRNVKLTADGGNMTVNAKMYFPLGPIQPYALVGAGGSWMHLRTRNYTGYTCDLSYWGYWCDSTYTELKRAGGFVAKFGGGGDVWITRKFGLSFDAVYVMPVGDLENFTYTSFSWGAIMKF